MSDFDFILLFAIVFPLGMFLSGMATGFGIHKMKTSRILAENDVLKETNADLHKMLSEQKPRFPPHLELVPVGSVQKLTKERDMLKADLDAAIDVMVVNDISLPDQFKTLGNIARYLAEINRLKRGDFTPEEFQNLCHHRDEKEGCTQACFFDGCAEYQTKLFGKSERDSYKDKIRDLIAERDKP